MYEDGGIFAIAFLGVYIMFAAIFGLLMLISTWVVINKAGKPGWACIIPIYNVILMLEIVNRPLWWLILCLFPLTTPIISIILTFDIAKAYGKDIGYGFGLLFLPIIFMPILAFGDAQYTGIERF